MPDVLVSDDQDFVDRPVNAPVNSCVAIAGDSGQSSRLPSAHNQNSSLLTSRRLHST